MLQKLPLRYLHGDAVAGSITSRSDGKFRSKPNEYDLFNIKSRALNLSSDWFLLGDGSAGTISVTVVSDSGAASLRGSRRMLSNIASSKLGRILAAITGMNGDSCRKIPARHRGQLA